jgi:hypothetical protein
MTACCGRRPNDGTIDREEVDRAVQGRSATLSPPEFELVVYRLARERRWGLQQIARHTGYSRSQVAATLAKQRRMGQR